ncbi:hypothetical protein P4U97_04235 [Bacillus swezeyi]|uniref:hypothetical protein n=1 Tax=Bacillus swezeyi TaxID=1925020 RepID=UPI002E2180D4|nr:hypothetical protein [Bacillus swezeyi]
MKQSNRHHQSIYIYCNKNHDEDRIRISVVFEGNELPPPIHPTVRLQHVPAGRHIVSFDLQASSIEPALWKYKTIQEDIKTSAEDRTDYGLLQQ